MALDTSIFEPRTPFQNNGSLSPAERVDSIVYDLGLAREFVWALGQAMCL